jgi:muramoyltetrapeptide carboxypeptidase
MNVLFILSVVVLTCAWPSALKNGDTVAIVATSAALSRAAVDKLHATRPIFARWGLTVEFGKNLFKNSTSQGGWAGFDHERLADIQDAVNNPKIRAIFIARGGYGSSRIVDAINWAPLRSSPKWVIGYSDITIFLTALDTLEISGGIHGEMPSVGFDNPYNVNSLEKILFKQQMVPLTGPSHRYNRVGTATAKIVGGNLSLLAAGLGTKAEINTKGKILLIEEIGENYYVLDRYLMSLKNANKLNDLAGLVIGQFTNCKPDSYYPGTHHDIIKNLEHLGKYPISYDVNFGHDRTNTAFPLGATGTLVVNESGSTLSMQF